MSYTDPTTATCIHCGRAITWTPDEGWHDTAAPVCECDPDDGCGCDSIWRESCDANHTDRRAAHEPAPLDTWMMFDTNDDNNGPGDEPSHEANIYPNGNGYVFAWYHTAVGMVTEAWHPTYAAAEDAAERAGYANFSA